jgi:hypothetical protein
MEVQLVCIHDEHDLQTIRQNNRLFYDNCQPNLQHTQNNGDRYAVVLDVTQEALLVLCQQYPYSGTPILVTALVVSTLAGLGRCVRFLGHMLHATYPWASSVRVHRNVIMHITDPQITIHDVHDTFVQRGFTVQ